MDKKIKDAIMNLMESESNLEQDFVIDLIKKYAPLLDTESIVNKEYKKMANQLISSFKDEKGIRDIFVITGDDDMTEYINVARSKQIKDLAKVRNRLKNNVEGNQKSLNKVLNRLFLLDNQMSISDLKAGES